jgi:putative ABC transport system substrate-binding protein
MTLVGSAVGWPFAARAQPSGQIRLVGVLMSAVESDPIGQSYLAAIRGALAKLGWTEKSNIRTAVRWGVDPALAARSAAELVALGAEVLVGVGSPAAAALQQQTHTTPIVFVAVADPIGQGFVASLARPGGNITGFSVTVETAWAGKELEILTQIEPPVARVAVLFNPATTPILGLTLHAIDEAVRSLKLPVQPAPVDTDSEIEAVMAEFAREQRGGLVVLPSVFTVGHRASIIDLAARYRLPAVYFFPLFATAGGLMAYGVEADDMMRRSADYVDRILKGARPGDLPVQQPTKFILVINLKTSKALGITIGPSLLAIADEVIE